MQRCSRCRIVFYCNQAHQKQDWAKHKKVCRAPTDEPESESQVDDDELLEAMTDVGFFNKVYGEAEGRYGVNPTTKQVNLVAKEIYAKDSEFQPEALKSMISSIAGL